MLQSSTVVLTATERVTLATPAAEAVAAEAERLGAKRVFILSSRFLAEQTDEIRRIEAALGDRHAATHTGIRPNAPRSDVLAAAEAARTARADLVVTVGGGSVTDAGKIVTICLKHNITTIEGFDRSAPMSKRMAPWCCRCSTAPMCAPSACRRHYRAANSTRCPVPPTNASS